MSFDASQLLTVNQKHKISNHVHTIINYVFWR